MIRSTLCVFLLVVIAGCRSVIDGERGFHPIIGRKLEGEANEIARWSIRPLGTRKTWDRDEQKYDLDILWPLFRRQRLGEFHRTRLLPLFYYRRYPKPQGEGYDSDGWLLPVAFWGSDPEEGSYFAPLPFGGTIKGLLGQHRIDAVLPPLFVRFVDSIRESIHILFPLVNHVVGPQVFGYRVLNIYSRYWAYNARGELKYSRRTFLWPFIQFYDENLATNRPIKIRWFWPFYGRIENASFLKQSYLWPLVQTEYGKRTGERNYALFPIFFWARGGYTEQTEVYPLFGIRRSPTYYRQFALWPIQRREIVQSEGRTIGRSWITPIYWSTETREAGQLVRRKGKLWPLWYWSETQSGQIDHRVLALSPFGNPEAFEEIYARLWQLFRYRSESNGRRAWELFWGLLQGEHRDSGQLFQVLGGFFEYSREDGRTRIRTLWIPW